MGIKLKNNAASTIPAALSSSATSVDVLQDTGSVFPALGSGDYFYATIISPTNAYEIVKVTARADDTLTIVRAQESTVAIPFLANARIALRFTVANLESFINDTDFLLL